MRFLEEASNVLFTGPPGAGKTSWHRFGPGLDRGDLPPDCTIAADLAARCHRAALEGRWATTMRYFVGQRLLINDDVGYMPLDSGGCRRESSRSSTRDT